LKVQQAGPHSEMACIQPARWTFNIFNQRPGG
jgi:hypothetical protein